MKKMKIMAAVATALLIATTSIPAIPVFAAAPTEVVSVKTSGYKELTVTWKKVDGTDYYEVFKSDTKNGQYTSVDKVKTTRFTDTDVILGKRYFYKIKAVTGGEEGDISEPMSARSYLEKTTGLTATEDTGKKHIGLSWNPVEGAQYYMVYRSTDGNSFALERIVMDTSFVDRRTLAGGTYFYKVRAYNVAAYGAYSDVATCTATVQKTQMEEIMAFVRTIKPTAVTPTPTPTTTPKTTVTPTPTVKAETPTTTPAPTTAPKDPDTPAPKPADPTPKPAEPTPKPAEPTPTPVPAHVHTWVTNTETVHHDEVGHYEEVVVGTRTVVDEEEYDEPVVKTEAVCSCGEILHTREDFDLHLGFYGHSYTTMPVVTDYIHHDAVTHEENVTETQWVVDSPAWDETISTTVCSGCGATK